MSEELRVEDDAAQKGHTSERGPFEINANPEITQPTRRDKINVDKAADDFAYEALAEKCGKEAAREKIGEMVKAFIPGVSVTPLLVQERPNGMSLLHVWFGPNFPLFRHSHPAYGDCLYCIIAGEITMGKRKLGPGSAFFLPNGHPYKYTAGPAGVELLEFRVGGGEHGAPGMKLDESSLDSLQKIIDESYANDHQWEVPERIGDTALRQAEIERKITA